MKLVSRALFPAAALASLSFAVETQVWFQKDFADYEHARLKKLSLSSDGRLTLAPVFREVFDSSSPYLWTLAEDSKDNLYAGGGGPGGSGARVYVIPPGGKGSVFAELEGLEVHALAIDQRDQVYAGVSPDGRVYRISAAGKAEVFYDPRTKYVWGMAFDSKGNLFVATGDRGEIHRVAPDGKGGVFYKTAETHARALAIDARDNLVLGTEPGGLIVRVSPKGEGFVLYQAARREITAVAVAASGSIYAAGVGAKQPAAPPPPASPAPVAPVPQPSPLPGAPAPQARPAPVAPAPLPTTLAPLSGGSEVYRIDPDGFPRKVWSHAQDIVYAIGFDQKQRPLIGAGNKGSIFRLDSERVHTVLLNAPPTQVTCLYAGRAALYAATGNIGQVYQIGPGLEKEGTVESDVLDAAMFSYWGRLSFRGSANAGQILLDTRSGNLDRPQEDWSTWSTPITAERGQPVSSPAARFLQWRATLRAGAGDRSPELRSVEIAYLRKNVAPVIEQIEVTPANYRFSPPALILTPSQTLTLPPLGRPQRAATPALTTDSGSVTMQSAKGHIGARWAAKDDNGDTLTYTVQIRGEKETEWKLLKDKVRDKQLSWDSTAFPDGEYRVRVIASDAPDNPLEQALTDELVGEPFLIDNTPPQLTGLVASAAGGKLNVRWKAADALSAIALAECSINGGEWLVIEPVGKLSDSREEEYNAALAKPTGSEHTIAVRVTDDYDNQALAKVVVRE